MMGTFFLVLAVLSVIWGVVSAIVITSWLSRRGVKINWFLIKILIIKYVHQYRQMTMAETGTPGPWFQSYVGSMLSALAFGIAGIALG